MKKANLIQCANLGMKRDKSISQLDVDTAEFAYDNHNIRITPLQDNTLLSVTNEQGTTQVCELSGTLIGHCKLNLYIVLFLVNTRLIPSVDLIYRFDTTTNEVQLIYTGSLNFSIDNPIETLSYYESDEVQKVYWVDGINPLRYINIMDVYPSGINTQFDCVGTLPDLPTITVEKDYTQTGIFTQGTILYFATFYTKFGTETNVVWQSDLLYLSLADRGCKEGENSYCVFNITITPPETISEVYDYLRLYSVTSTSEGAIKTAAIVTEISVDNLTVTRTIIDDGVNQISFPASELPFIGGQNIIPSTLTQKDDTLFVGDITLSNTKIPQDSDLYIALTNTIERTYEEDITINTCNGLTFVYKDLPTPEFEGKSYAHEQQLLKSQADIAGFKYREVYRFALQFLTSKGEWTDPIYIGDGYCNLAPKYDNDNKCYQIATVTYTSPTSVTTALNNWNNTHTDNPFIQARLLVAETDISQRRIAALGVVNPTMFNYYDRLHNKPYSINSWLFRPRRSHMTNRHYDAIPPQNTDYAEIQGIVSKKTPGYDPQSADSTQANSYGLAILFGGDWITQHKIGYVLYKYINDGNINVNATYNINGVSYTNCVDYRQFDHNLITEVKSNYVFDNSVKNKEEARTWLLNELTDHLGITDAMVPSADLLKQMARASEFTDNPDAVFGVIGAALVTIAGIVLTCCTFGTGTAISVPTIEAVWAGVIASVGATVATAGTAGVATLANVLKDAPDIDKAVARYGYYTLLPSFNHSLTNKKKYVEQYNRWVQSYFAESDNIVNIANWSDFAEPNTSPVSIYILMGRLNFQSPKELDALSKQEQYYVDESIVTLNSPEIEENRFVINDATNLSLQLIGTIPITANYGDVSLYTATLGVVSNASTLHTTLDNGYPSTLIEGILNGGLYLDQSLTEYKYDSVANKWPDIIPTVSLDTYRIFMWHRDSSWSCYIPTINIVDPISILDLENPVYLNYIPAIPKKKVFSNLKFSHNTIYNSPYTLSIETPKIHITETDNLIQLQSNELNRNYYPNVNTLIVNTDGYVLVDAKGGDMWAQYNDGNVQHKLLVFDPVSLKFNSTSHVSIPLKWKNNLHTILPYVNDEQPFNLNQYPLTKTTIIEGVQLTEEYTTVYQFEDSNFNPHLESITTDVAHPIKTNDVFMEDWKDVCEAIAYTHWTIILNESDDIKNQFYEAVTYAIKSQNMNNSSPIVDNNWNRYLVYNSNDDTFTIYTITEGSEIIYGTILEVNGESFQNAIEESVDLSLLLESYKPTFSYTHLSNVPIHVIVNEDTLNWNEPNPYLFMGELIRPFDYNTWLGGISEFALELLNWKVCSLMIPFTYSSLESGGSGGEIEMMSLNTEIDPSRILLNFTTTATWGDTYYQRWDCLKTYPTTEEDKNSIVDVLSFMVETHINLDGRCDINRGVNNLINARPNNFNLINKAYTQTDNMFLYKILDTKFEKNSYPNQVVWSLTKTVLDDVDKWTQINAVNFLNLNGTCGKLRKLINVNDVIVAFQDTGMCTIDYNQKAALSTVEGVPVQLGNTNKVTGYTVISDKIGCHNKWSINLNSTGLYFIDDYKKSLNRFTGNNIESLSTVYSFSNWFAENLDGSIWSPNNTNAFRLSFDENTKDLYVVRSAGTSEDCLIFNTLLNKFVSFMDYSNCYICDGGLNSYAIQQDTISCKIHTMFTGDYNSLLNIQQPYWITYRLNPSPYTDNLFTNFTYVADIGDITNNEHLTFTSVKAWNEYLTGELNLTSINNRHRHAKDKYRIWRGDIPRDGDTLTSHVYGGNRMRNPWLYLKLNKDTTNDLNKMVFHNLTVTYYK